MFPVTVNFSPYLFQISSITSTPAIVPIITTINGIALFGSINTEIYE